jgi:hypothetical protein
MSASAQNFLSKAGAVGATVVLITMAWKTLIQNVSLSIIPGVGRISLNSVVALSAVPIFENKKSEIQLHE